MASNDSGNTPRGLNTSISDGRLVTKFLDDLQFRRQMSPHTVSAYKSDLRFFTAFLHNEVNSSLSGCSREIIADFLIQQENDGASGKTRARRLASIRGLYEFLKFTGAISINPVEGVKSPVVQRSLPNFLAVDEINRLISTGLHGDKYQRRTGMLVELIYASGLRISEALSLKPGHLNLDAGFIIVESGKGGKARNSLIPPSTCDNLRNYLAAVRPEFTREGEPSPWVFTTNRGGPLSRSNAWSDMQKLAVAAEIESELHPHILRHSFATHLVENNCDIRTVQFLLGHADISTTEIYTHVAEERKRQVFKRTHPRAVIERKKPYD